MLLLYVSFYGGPGVIDYLLLYVSLYGGSGVIEC